MFDLTPSKETDGMICGFALKNVEKKRGKAIVRGQMREEWPVVRWSHVHLLKGKGCCGQGTGEAVCVGHTRTTGSAETWRFSGRWGQGLVSFSLSSQCALDDWAPARS